MMCKQDVPMRSMNMSESPSTVQLPLSETADGVNVDLCQGGSLADFLIERP